MTSNDAPMPTTPKPNSSEIDERARRIFQSALPDDWIPMPLNPDKDHLDYRVVMLRDFTPIGLDFLVQVKGILEPSTVGENVAYQFEREHVEYWVDRQRRPVIVVVVDVGQRQAYWQSVQHWARDVAREWRGNQTAVTIHLPLQNRLEDRNQLFTAVQEADALARERHAPSLADRMRRLEEIDARFQHEIRLADGVTNHMLRAKTDVRFAVQAKGTRGAEKLQNVMERGLPANFEPGELRFSGGGMFDEMTRLAERSTVTFEAKSMVPCDIALAAVDGTGRQLSLLYGIRGQLVGGMTQRRILAQLESGLVTASGIIQLIPPNGLLVNYSLAFDTTPWTAQPVLALPHFDRVRDFFLGSRPAASMRLSLEIFGQPLTAEMPENNWRPMIEAIGPRIDFIDQARRVASHLRVNPQLPDLDTISREEIDEFLLLLDLVEKGRIERPGSDYSISGSVPFSPPDPTKIEPERLFEQRLMLREQGPAVLFGAISEDYIVEYEYRHLAFSDESREALRAAFAQDAFPVRLSLTGSPDSRILTTLVNRRDKP